MTMIFWPAVIVTVACVAGAVVVTACPCVDIPPGVWTGWVVVWDTSGVSAAEYVEVAAVTVILAYQLW